MNRWHYILTAEISYITWFSYKMETENSYFRISDFVHKFPDNTNHLKKHDMNISIKTTFSFQEFLPDMFPSLWKVCITWPINMQLMIHIMSEKSFERKETNNCISQCNQKLLHKITVL
jgi:hypothetical protein